MIDFDAIVKKAENNLNESFRLYQEESSGLAQEFMELKLQASIFQYDICAEMVGILRNQSKGFAASVALKGLVLRLFEYDLTLNRHLLPRLLSLAKSREISVDQASIGELKKKWKSELTALQAWHKVRNQAAGHYGKDLAAQVNLLSSLKLHQVMSVTEGFLSFNVGLLQILRDAGRGKGASA